MTSSPAPEPLEALPIPYGAVELDVGEGLPLRELAVAGLRRAMRDRRLALSLGPQSALADQGRLLSLNRFAVQLVPAGIAADQIPVDLAPWAEAATAPQLLLAALVDDENEVVAFPGALTGEEVLALARGAERSDQVLLLDTAAFRGGVDRLLTLVQVLEPAALPRLALASAPVLASVSAGVVAVTSWLHGQLDEALARMGGELRPVSAGAFRSRSVAIDPAQQALAMLVIPFGLQGDQLVSGDAARRCVRRFQLALIPTGVDQPNGIILRLSSAVEGALLPDGLRLEASQGTHHQAETSADATELVFLFQGSSELLEVSLRYGIGEALVLPPLQLPA
jgi:hypothetical protein